jgi:hypothetical protein
MSYSKSCYSLREVWFAFELLISEPLATICASPRCLPPNRVIPLVTVHRED